MFIGRENITGMVTLSQDLQTNQTLYFDNSLLGGSATLSFGLGDAIPSTAVVNISIANTTTEAGDAGIKSSEKSISVIFGSNAPPINSSGLTADKDINNPEAAWEGKQTETYNFSDTRNYALDLKDFSLNVPDLIDGSAARNYNVVFNVTWLCLGGGPNCQTTFNITTSVKQITVRSNNISDVNSISLANANGSNVFKANDYVNCTATIIDANNDTPVLAYSIWGPTKNASTPSKQGNIDTATCSGTNWNIARACTASVQITSSELTRNSDFGQWNCNISADDGYGVNSSASSNAFTMSNTPVAFYGRFKNVSWYNDSKKDDEFKLEATSVTGDGFYDPDSTLNYTVKGNSSINVTIGSNGYVSFVGKLKNFTGTEFVTFNASDGFSTAVSNSINLTVYSRVLCIADWICEGWSDCTNNIQFRECTDANSCDSSMLTKTENQTCTSTPAAEGQPITSQQNTTTVTVPSQQQATTKEEGNIGKTVLVSLGVLALIAGLGVGIFLLYKYMKREKKPAINLEIPVEKRLEEVEEVKIEERKPEETMVEPVNVSDLRDYIKKAVSMKKPISVIKEELVRAGWDKVAVENEMNVMSLSNYIQTKLDQGVKKEAIIETLKAKGWKEDQINEAFKNTRVKPLF